MNSKAYLWIGILASLLLLTFFLFKIVINIATPFDGDGDPAYSYFIFDNNLRKLKALNFSNIFDTRMFYPHKNTLAFGESYLTQSIIGLPAYLITNNVIVSSHFIILINFFIAYLAMYLLAYKLTKNIGGSILAGLIYTYNPFVMAQFQHYEAITLVFIPAIFLTTESLLEKVSWKKSAILGFLFLAQLASSIYYFFFLILLLPIYVILRGGLYKLKHLISLKLITCLIIFGILGLLYLKPYLQVKDKYQVSRGLQINTLLSTQPTDFLFTSPGNKLYGFMVNDSFWRSFRSDYTNKHPSEHSLFPGLTVYVLLLIMLSLYLTGRFGNDQKRVGSFLWLFLIVLVLSLGPYIFFGSIKIPSLYLLVYRLIPFADSLRVPSRFMIIGFLALAILVSFTLQKLSKKGFMKAVFIFAVLFLMLEYRHDLGHPYFEKEEVKQFYSWLDYQKSIKVILELPMYNFFPGVRPYSVGLYHDAKYLMYGTYHQKRLVNGFNSFVPNDVLEFGSNLTINFPSREGLTTLKQMGIDTLVVHLDDYPKEVRQNLIEKLKEFSKLDYNQGQLFAFSLQ